MLKRFNNKKNISGTLIKEAREEKKMSKVRLSQLLDTYGVYINTDELLRIEKNKVLVKDFELVAIAQILDIDLNKLKDYLED
mgnify:CR=1 FL=1